MTPLKSKKPLPSSTSMAFPEQPITPEQWTTALQRLKALYLRGQLRQCAIRCDQLLSETKTMPNPLFAPYLHFYSALSTEGLARLTHNLSASKIPSLLQAKESYRKAVLSLPPRDNFGDATESQARDTATEPSSPSSGKAHPCSISSPLSPNSIICPSSPASLDLRDSFESSPPAKRPSPLRIHKKPTLRLTTTISTPPRTPPTQIFPDPPSRPSSVSFSAATSIWLRTRARERFTAHLDSFRDMLARHVDVIEGLVHTAEAAQQRSRRAGKRLGGSSAVGGDGDMGGDAERKSTAIARGRERGWARPRFQPERYTVLCEQVLSEM